MNYILMSSNLSTQRPTLGVLAGWQYYWTATPLSYLDPIYRGVRLAAQKLNCNLLLGCGMGSSAVSSDPLRPAWPVVSDESDFLPIGPWNTNGLIVVNPLHSENRSGYMQKIIAQGYPVMFIGSGEPGHTIVAENAKGIAEAQQHLVDHGHHIIAFIAGSPEDMDGDSGARLRAFQEGVSAYGLAADERLIAFGRHVFESGRSAMQQILATGIPFTAVLASNDESALGAINALEAVGKRVPDDVAIIGFDDRPESAVQRPALTSIQIPLFKMGFQAVERLLELMDGQSPSPQQFQVPTRLVIRESCGCGRSAIIEDALGIASPQVSESESDRFRSQLVQMMTASVLARTQVIGKDEVELYCRHLIESFVTSVTQHDPSRFQHTLDLTLRQVAVERDDAHIWQVAISIFRDELEQWLSLWPQPAPLDLAFKVLDQARVTISAAMRRQHLQYIAKQKWTDNRVGLLTSRLLTVLDESHVYEILGHFLPEMGIRTAWVGLFEAEGNDPVAWSQLRSATTSQLKAIRIRSREFPPGAWLEAEEPFSLALLPLIGQRGGSGFVAFDAVHLDLLGAITQQMGAALNTAQLYREATEGRRLAEEANQIKSRFLSTVSHELRTPLNLIVGMSGLLLQENEKDGESLPDPIQRDIQSIQTNARHLGRLINDVLDLANSDAGQLRLTYEFVDLGQTMRMVAEIGERFASEKGLAWHTTLPESGPWVWGDPTRLRQVTLNLISNAVKYTAKGEIRLDLETGPDSVTVSVQDTGIGMPLNEQQVIFEEFHRSERSIRRGYSGLGLGLAISKRLINMHQGTIGVRSSGEEGAGSNFFFTLPTVPAPTSQTSPPNLRPKTSQQILMLSSHGNGQRLRSHLTRRGFRVKTIPLNDSVNWLSQLLNKPYSAIVLDISQSAESSWQALKLLKGNPATQHIPVLLYAATLDTGDVLELDYLTKPIEVAELTRALDQHWLAADTTIQTHTFLIVDDDPNTLDLHTRIIQSQSKINRVLSARNGIEALEIMHQTQVDLVLLDLMMPEMDGFDVLEAMRRHECTRNIPVIVITGQVLTEAEMARLNRGVATVMSKGLFGLDETLTHLESALKRKHKLSDEAQRMVRKAMVYIHEHYDNALSRKDLARYVGMNADYLTYCFRQELGMTPIAYLNRYRIIQAKRLLDETDMNITVIALDVGFSSSGYFSRVFRREVGLSPEEYRRHLGTDGTPV